MPDSDIQAKQMEISRTLLICVVLAVATFVAFEGVRSNDFVHYDDDQYVTGNEYMKKGIGFESIKWAFTTWYQGNWHPLTWMSHLIDSAVFGMEPAGHHLVSVGFHIANVILLFLIFKKMTGAIWPSAFVAAIFGLHPMGVESVAWVAERKNVLSNLFAFLTIWAYLWYAQKPGWRRYAVIAVLFAAGLLSKSMLVTLPFVLILLDYWPMGRFGNLSGWRWLWRAIVDKSPLLAMSAAFCVVTYLAQLNAEAVLDIVSLPLGLRVSNAMMSYIRYIGKLFYPTPLAVLYPLDIKGYSWVEIGGCLALLLAATTVVILERRQAQVSVDGMVMVSGDISPGYRPGPGGRAGDGGQVYVSAGYRDLYHSRLACGRSSGETAPAQNRSGDNRRGDFGCVAADNEDADRVLEGQRIAVSTCPGCNKESIA